MAHIVPSLTSGYGKGVGRVGGEVGQVRWRGRENSYTKKRTLTLGTLTPLYQVVLYKHSTYRIHNLICLELSGLRGRRSTQIF